MSSNQPPHGDPFLEVFERLKDIFQRAAQAPTGTAQPLFQELSDIFCNAIDDAAHLAMVDRRAALQQLFVALQEIQPVIVSLERAAQTNPAAEKTLRQVEADLQTELMRAGDRQRAAENKKPQAPQKPKKPYRPPGGDFDL